MQVTNELSSKAFRLMALAVGVLPRLSKLDVHRLSQKQLEKHATKLELLGLIVLTNPIKPDSRNTVTELQDKYGSTHLCTHCCLCSHCVPLSQTPSTELQ